MSGPPQLPELSDFSEDCFSSSVTHYLDSFFQPQHKVSVPIYTKRTPTAEKVRRISSDAPPSYDSVIEDLKARLGLDPNPQQILDIVENLSKAELEVLGANADKQPALTVEVEAAVNLGIASTIVSEGASRHLQDAAAAAAATCAAIETMFGDLTITLASIDSMYPKAHPFLPRLKTIHQSVRRIIHDSGDLAVKIADYGLRFDAVIIPICNDQRVNLEKRKARLREFIKDAETFSVDARSINDRFNEVKGDFATFTGTFTSWTTDKRSPGDELKKLAREIADLEHKITELLESLFSFGDIALASSGGIPYAISLMWGSIGPFVIAGGLVFAGVSLGFVLTKMSSINSHRKQLSDKKREAEYQRTSIKEVRWIRRGLMEMGQKNLESFRKSIAILELVWKGAHNDALSIQNWLEGGEKDADLPPYMMISVDNAINIYKTMASYLRLYADGVSSYKIPRPSS